MRVVVVHNRYRSAQPSGENQVVEDDIAALRAEGVEVEPYIRDSDDIPSQPWWERALLPIRPTWSPVDVCRFGTLARSFQPDVVHLHNVYPLISPGIIRTAKRSGAVVVQTVHNYRHACVNGIRFRAGATCDDCVGRSLPLPAIRHRCYHDSRGASLSMASALAVGRPAWRLVDAFLPVGPGVAEFLVDTGVAPSRIRVVPNRITTPDQIAEPGKHIVFIGRLTVEKGVDMLLDSWELLDRPSRDLLIAGDGPLRDDVARRAREIGRVRYLGLLDPSEVDDLIATAAVVTVPSLWHEPDPLVAIRAMSAGRPVLATRLGAFVHYLDDTCGWLVEPSTEGLAAGLSAAVSASADDLARRGRAARAMAIEQRGRRPSLATIYSDLVASARGRT